MLRAAAYRHQCLEAFERGRCRFAADKSCSVVRSDLVTLIHVEPLGCDHTHPGLLENLLIDSSGFEELYLNLSGLDCEIFVEMQPADIINKFLPGVKLLEACRPSLFVWRLCALHLRLHCHQLLNRIAYLKGLRCLPSPLDVCDLAFDGCANQPSELLWIHLALLRLAAHQWFVPVRAIALSLSQHFCKMLGVCHNCRSLLGACLDSAFVQHFHV